MGAWGTRLARLGWLGVALTLAVAAPPANGATFSVPATAVGPSVQSPIVAFTNLGQIGPKNGIPLTVSWPPGTPNGAPIYGYQLQKSVDRGPWVSIRLPSRLATSVAVKLRAWGVLRFRLRATDTSNQIAEWQESQPRWISAAQENDPSVSLSPGWTPVADSAAFEGARATTTQSAETATYTFTGREVAWVARLGPDRGTADVSLDAGPTTSVNLYRSAASSRRLVFEASWPTVGSHSLTLTTTGSGLSVDVDAFLVATDPQGQTIVGAGDISTCSNTHDSSTEQLLNQTLTADPTATVFTAGDNVYPDGSLNYFTDCYDPSWGLDKANTRPVPGNHDYYNNPGAAGYFAYFGAAAGNGSGWYKYDARTWRIYALTSECDVGSDCYNAQYAWLQTDLAQEPHRCALAIWHRPRFSTGPHGSSARMASVFQLLYDNGADVVINGHDHMYERYVPQDPSGTPDATRGIREFVVGTGGASLYAFKTDSPLIAVRDNSTYGVLKLDLEPGAYSWQFLPAGSGTFTDSGAASCH